jgi:hypothetical protein
VSLPCGGDLADCRWVFPKIDTGDYLAGRDVLIVGDRNGRDIARHFGRNGELTRRDLAWVGIEIVLGNLYEGIGLADTDRLTPAATLTLRHADQPRRSAGRSGPRPTRRAGGC